MNLKELAYKGKDLLADLRYKLVVAAGMGFDAQVKYFPDHTFQKRVFKIRTESIKWAYASKPTVSKELLVGGNWDIISKVPLAEFLKTNDSCHTIFQIFEQGLPFQESDQYKTIKGYVLSGVVGPGWQARGSYNVADIDRYFEKLAVSFNNMKANGYKAQSELGNPQVLDELTVVVDRNGEFQKQEGEGHHRLAMAVLLQIPTIPVIIKRIHLDWAKEQFAKYNTDLLTCLTKGLAAQAVPFS